MSTVFGVHRVCAAAAYCNKSTTTRRFLKLSSRAFSSTQSTERQDEPSSSSSSSTSSASASWTVNRQPIIPYPQSPRRLVPNEIPRPPYAHNGIVPISRFPEQVLLHDTESANRMRRAARLARAALDYVCNLVKVGITTDELDAAVHEYIIQQGHAYPSPLNYAGFPKSVCSSINEVICHGIPDIRPLQFGDVVSLDVSCFLGGVHGDNCATVIVGDYDGVHHPPTAANALSPPPETAVGCDWRGIPHRTQFVSPNDEAHFVEARRLVETTRESLYKAIQTCEPGSCLSDIGAAIDDVATREGYASVRKYRGHGICHEFHCAPFVKHYRNNDRLILQPGMIFTIEPMLIQKLKATNSIRNAFKNTMMMSNDDECYEWDDEWTVSTVDGGLAAQFEHTILITDTGNEILTLPEAGDHFLPVLK